MPASMLEPVNRDLWNSSTRIFAAYRMQEAGRLQAAAGRGPTIPVDVARAMELLLDDEKTYLARTVSRCREIDGDATSQYNATAGREGFDPIPAGGTVFEPVYRQYLELEASPSMPELRSDGYVWTDMPFESYLVNRLSNPTPFDQEMLTRLGYVASVDDVGSGIDVLPIDEAKITRSVEVREALASIPITYKNVVMRGPLYKVAPAAAAPIVLQAGSQSVVIVIGIVAFCMAVGAMAIWVLPKWIEAQSFDEGLETIIKSTTQAHEWNNRRAEQSSKIIDYCIEHAAATGRDASHCAGMADDLYPYQQPPDPGEAIAQLAGAIGCGWNKCWMYTGTGIALGAVAGAYAASRLT